MVVLRKVIEFPDEKYITVSYAEDRSTKAAPVIMPLQLSQVQDLATVCLPVSEAGLLLDWVLLD